MGRQQVIATVLLGLFALGLIGGGSYILVVQHSGTRADAVVTDCHRRGRSTYCTGTWTVGGDLTAGGRVVQGTIEGANRDDIGETLDVRLSGGRAYTTSLRLPLILIGLGLAVALLWGMELWRSRARARPRAAGGDAAWPGAPSP